MKTIIITEKPSVAQEYKKVLQVKPEGKTNGYVEGFSPILSKDVIITWAVGHLIGILEPEKQDEKWEKPWRAEQLPMIPKPFKYAPLKDTYDQFKVVKSIYMRKDIESIYYAGDSGREGIYIQALIRNQIFRSKPDIEEKVVWIDSFTDEAILGGIKNAKPLEEYQPLIDSGYARAIADWLVGMNFTRGLSLKNNNNTVNVGRVLTPTLAMIVKRQEEIDNFVKTPYYGIKADNFANWKAVKGSKYYESDLLYNEGGFVKKEDAQAFISELESSMKLTVEKVKVTQKTEYAPYLFNLADLQALCSKRYHISPADTLKYAQSLYEKKFTTYPRTDCRFLSSAVAKELKEKHSFNVPDRYIDDSKITDHYAIIPTFEGNTSSLAGMELNVYNLIYKRFMNIMLPPYIYDAVSVVYIHQSGERFFEGFRKVKQMGFKESEEKIEDDDKNKKNEDGEDNEVDKPIPQEGTVVPINAYNLKEQETKPPLPYTTGTLIMAMEKAGKLIEDEELREQIKTSGIGTSATRAEIIKNLERKGYITVDNKQKVAPTEYGKAVIPLIAQFDENLISPVKTAEMEEKLNDIALNRLSKDEYMMHLEQYIVDSITSIKSKEISAVSRNGNGEQYICPLCNNPINYGKYGWYCSNHENCKFGLNIELLGHTMKESDLKDLIEKGRTKKYSFKNKEGKKFEAAIAIDKEKGTIFDFSEDNTKTSGEKHSCPLCKSEIKYGQYGWFCSNRENCKFGLRNNLMGHEMTENDLKDLIEKGKTQRHTFINSDGKKFDAAIALDNEKGTVFDFSGDAQNKSSEEENNYKCPKCGSNIKHGQYGWYCANKDFSLNSEICGHSMTETDLKDLLEKGKTKVYLFKSKEGKKFKAKIVINKEKEKGHSFEFVFDK